MRLRKTPSLHPAVSEELAVLDAALRGDALEPEHEQLRELVLAVRDVAPRPRPEFIDDLDAAVDAGFPGGTGARGRHWPRAWGRATAALAGAGRKRGRVQLALAACGALGVVAAGVVALGTLRGEGGSPTLTPPPSARPETLSAPARGPSAPAIPARSQKGTRAARGVASGGSVAAAPGEQLSPPIARRVQRGASLTLATPSRDLSTVADQVVGVTDRLGGIVRSSEVTSGDSSTGQASFDLSIPVGRLDTALAELSQLAHVRSRQQSSLDITDSYDAARQRLNQELAQRQSLLRQLGRAGSRRRARSIRVQLRPLQNRIRAEQKQLAGLQRSSRYADVGVLVEATSDSHGAAGPWTVGRALHDALRVLTVALGVIVVALSALVPVALLAALAALVLRAGRRHAREQALEQG